MNRYRIQFTEVKPGGHHTAQDVALTGDRSDVVRYLAQRNVLAGSVTVWENEGGRSDRAGVNIGGLGWNPEPKAEEAAAAAPVKVTHAGSEILDTFRSSARQAELNGGTLIFGGRVQAPAAAKLVRDGLLVRVGTSRITYRLTEAGQVWLVEHTAKLEAERAEFARIIAEREAAAALRFQVVHLGYRYYAVRDTKVGKNVQTMCGTADALQRAEAAAELLNAAPAA